jgi:hypothetical protein
MNDIYDPYERDDIYGGWETLDTAALLARRDEATTMANVGSYTVPLGTDPLRRAIPVGRLRGFPACRDNEFCALDADDRPPYWGPNMQGSDPFAKRMY